MRTETHVILGFSNTDAPRRLVWLCFTEVINAIEKLGEQEALQKLDVLFESVNTKLDEKILHLKREIEQLKVIVPARMLTTSTEGYIATDDISSQVWKFRQSARVKQRERKKLLGAVVVVTVVIAAIILAFYKI